MFVLNVNNLVESSSHLDSLVYLLNMYNVMYIATLKAFPFIFITYDINVNETKDRYFSLAKIYFKINDILEHSG